MAFSRLTDQDIAKVVSGGKIYAAYRNAQAGLEKIIWEVEQTGIPMLASQYKRISSLQNQLGTLISRLEKVGKEVAPAYVKELYKLTQSITSKEISSKPGVKSFKSKYSHLDNMKVLMAANAMQNNLYGAARSSTSRVENIIRRVSALGAGNQMVTEAIAGGQITGASIRDMSLVVRNIIKEEVGTHNGTVAVKGKDGVTRRYQLAKYAETIVRTQTREIATMATKQTMMTAAAELGIRPLVEISRHADESDICLDILAGSVDNRFSLVPDDDEYPYIETEGEGGPPWHPNCRHVATPYVEPVKQSEQDASLPVV